MHLLSQMGDGQDNDVLFIFLAVAGLILLAVTVVTTLLVAVLIKMRNDYNRFHSDVPSNDEIIAELNKKAKARSEH